MNTDLASRDQQVVWHPYTQMKNAAAPIAIVRGEGAYLYDDQGKAYLDAISSWWVTLHGHAHPYITKKISEQLATLEHVIFAGFTHEPAVRLAERLLPLLPGKQSKAFYSDNGSTAVEVAIKMAIQYWHNQGIKKQKILVLEHSYHGDTFGAMSVSARSAFTAAFSSFLFEVVTLPFPEKDREQECLKALEHILAQHNDLAAFIFEPMVLGAGGMLMYEPETLSAMMALCRQHGVLCIADEVMTGFGRTGKLFACEHQRQQPDIVCLSKGLTGGVMALGLTTCTEEVYQAFLSDDKLKTLFHGHSFTANPLACTAALASLDLLLDASTRTNIDRICAEQQGFAEELQAHPGFKNPRCRGTILAVDVKSTENTSYFHSQRNNIYQHFLDQGILLRPLGNTLYILPPYCIGEDLQRVQKQLAELSF